MNNKYENHYYWDNAIKKDGIDELFSNNPVNEQSVFFHGLITDCYSGCIERWICFPDEKALLGFIYYVFVPTAFANILVDNVDLSILVDNLSEFISLINDSDKPLNKELLPFMKEFDNDFMKLWDMEKSECIRELILLSKKYEEKFTTRKDKCSYFNIYTTPLELGEYIVSCYTNSDYVDEVQLEAQLGVSTDEWIEICKNVYHNDFMKRRFTEIINNRITDIL